MPWASDDREVFAGDNGIRNVAAPAILTYGFIICDSTSLQSEMSTLKFLRRLFPVAAFLGGFVWDALTIGQRVRAHVAQKDGRGLVLFQPAPQGDAA